MEFAAAQPPNVAVSRVSKTTIDTAINALLKFKATQSSNEKLQLLPSDDYIYLNLTLKKIPSNSRTNPFRIPLAHPILDQSSQLCLIIDDRAKTPTPPSDQIKKLIKSQNIPISKVIKLSKLKANYKPFEGKRKLCDSYDLFLVDKRIVHLLPKLIGKEFFKKKKLPLGVDLSKYNLKLQVERALGSALLYLRTGTCCVMKVGKVSMEKDEIVENAVAAIEGAVERVPKKWEGVRSLHLKFYDSVALPIYQAMPDVKLKIEGVGEREKRAELAKASDSEGELKEVRGTKDRKSGQKKKKGRIHEVRFMDVGDGIEIDDDVNVDESELVRGEDNDELVGQVRMEENVMEEIDDDNDDEGKKTEDGDISITESVGKKRNKRRAVKEQVLGALDGPKRVKKNAKSEKIGVEVPKKNAKLEKIGDEKLKKNANSEKIGDKVLKKNANSEKIGEEKLKKNGLSGGEESGGKKGKTKSELGKRQSERIANVKDTKQKKRVSAK